MDTQKFLGKKKVYEWMKHKYGLRRVIKAPLSPDYQGTDALGANYYDLKTKKYYVLSGNQWYVKNG